MLSTVEFRTSLQVTAACGWVLESSAIVTGDNESSVVGSDALNCVFAVVIIG